MDRPKVYITRKLPQKALDDCCRVWYGGKSSWPGLTELDNVILAPHIASASIETRTKMAVIAAKNLLAGLKGEEMPNLLNPDSLK